MVHFRSRGIGLEQCIQLMKNSRNGTIWFHGEREKNTKLFFYHYLTVDLWVQFRDTMAYGSLIFLIGGIIIGIICFLIGMLIDYFIATFANISINLHEINQKL